jgi:glycosyltransferase involved in cell wall biosynthesis
MYRGMRVAVVIPAYNEERHIVPTVRSVPAFVDTVIVVDDCSSDRTVERVMPLVCERVQLVLRERNGGVGAAILSGYELAVELEADVAAVMAGDGQMDPAELPSLLDPLAEDQADYVKGNRLWHPELWSRMPRTRVFGNRALSVLTRFSSGYRHVTDSQCGYTALTRRFLAQIDSERVYPRYGFPNDLLAHLKELDARVLDVPVTPIYGDEQSGIRPHLAIFTLTYVLARAFVLRQWRTHVRRLRALPAPSRTAAR